MRATLSCALLLLGAACGSGGTVTPPPAWTLVWSDEFDGAAGPIDASKWVADLGVGPGNDGWGNQQLEFDTGSTDNAALDGQGHLVITALKQSQGGRSYTSARLITYGTFSQKYGRVEARMKLPAGQGLWPAFWMLGDNVLESGVGWPACGEIDIMELRGQEPSTAVGSLHGPGYSGGSALSDRYLLAGAKFSDDFHVFAVEWDPSRISFFVDDERYRTFTAESVQTSGKRWVYDHPFFLILNLAVGGTFVGAPNAQTVFPATMTVDWVRVSRRAP